MSTLKLEIVGPHAAALGTETVKVFGPSGGTIGRLPGNDWVLADPYISGRHARIHWRNDRFLIEDTSSNGVFINAPDRRLARGKLHPLQNGDRVFVDAYEILVIFAPSSLDPAGAMPRPFQVSQPAAMPEPLQLAEDPFAASDSWRAPTSQRGAKPANAEVLGFASPLEPPLPVPESIDPIRLLGLAERRASQSAPRAEDLAGRSMLSDHYQPPAPITATPRNAVETARRAQTDRRIPDSYDLSLEAPASAPEPAGFVPPRPAHSPQVTNGALDLQALLDGAGLHGVPVTSELAESFGRVLRTVVAGLMDVLRAREQIKNEFRMGMTSFKAADNNPLKFSANVEDALHNLLVKRNAAYMKLPEAFEDAFADVRNHQMAMLAGVRVAFDAMLADFDPERLQETFDRQLIHGSLLRAPARMKYWDMYRDRYQDMAKDRENSFRELFGDDFARAYEAQLGSFKAARDRRA